MPVTPNIDAKIFQAHSAAVVRDYISQPRISWHLFVLYIRHIFPLFCFCSIRLF
jgi:hypothetical protein